MNIIIPIAVSFPEIYSSSLPLLLASHLLLEEIKKWNHDEKGHSLPAHCVTLVALHLRCELW